MKRCTECDMLLISLGFNYYFHPKQKDFAGRTRNIVYQCPISLDPINNTFKIQSTEPAEKIPEELALERSILSY